MDNLETLLIKALSLLHQQAHAITNFDMGIVLTAAFTSSESSSQEYVRSPLDASVLAELKVVDAYREDIDRLRNTLSSVHVGKNTLTATERSIKVTNGFIAGRSADAHKLEEIIDGLDSSFYDISAKQAIIGAYRSCRESFITVKEMIKTYNGLSEEFAKSQNQPFTKLSDLIVPKDVSLPV